jgi:hypothetical protein
MHRKCWPLARAARFLVSFTFFLFIIPTHNSHAGTIFTAACETISTFSFPKCTEDSLAAIGASATIAFLNDVPLDGTTFSSPATLSMTLNGFSKTIDLPTGSYSYTTNPPATRFSEKSLRSDFAGTFFSLNPSTDSHVRDVVQIYSGFIPIIFDHSTDSLSRANSLLTTFAPELAPSLYVNLVLETPQTTGLPTRIVATATVGTSPPPLGNSYLVKNISLHAGTTTLQQAANDLHFTGFNWVQKITQWVNPTLFYVSDPCVAAHPDTFPRDCQGSAVNAPTYDPVAGGYAPPSPAMWKELGHTSPPPKEDSYATPPYYYHVDGPTDATSLTANLNDFGGLSHSECSTRTSKQPTGAATSLCFSDMPDDPLLTSAQIESRLYPTFTTELVGLCDTPGQGDCNSEGYDPLFKWTWATTYNGNGCQDNDPTKCVFPTGLPGLPSNAGPVYPYGTGGIRIINIDGTPVSEPSSILLLAASLISLLMYLRLSNSLWSRR